MQDEATQHPEYSLEYCLQRWDGVLQGSKGLAIRPMPLLLPKVGHCIQAAAAARVHTSKHQCTCA